MSVSPAEIQRFKDQQAIYDCLTARTVGGRYLDRLERRDGAWAIAERTYVLDWNSNVDSTVDRDGSYFGELARGRTDRSDDSYALFAGLRP